jgi:hypothetical protein
MVNYQDGKIYKIVDNTNGNIYIGSTCEPTLARRLAGHVKDYRNYLNGNFNFVSSFKIIENNNYDIVLIENVMCNSKDELHSRERYHIDNTDCVNINLPTRTHKQYLEDKKEQVAKVSKEYHTKNKEKIRNQRKEHYEENKEVFANKHKEWYDLNRTSILEKNKEEITCECGLTTIKHHIARHRKSQKHLNLIKNINL